MLKRVYVAWGVGGRQSELAEQGGRLYRPGKRGRERDGSTKKECFFKGSRKGKGGLSNRGAGGLEQEEVRQILQGKKKKNLWGIRKRTGKKTARGGTSGKEN